MLVRYKYRNQQQFLSGFVVVAALCIGSNTLKRRGTFVHLHGKHLPIHENIFILYIVLLRINEHTQKRSLYMYCVVFIINKKK